MPAPTGNKNAQRWTLEKTIDTLNFIDVCSFNEEFLYLGQALSKAGYYNDLWAYWRRKWRKEYEVISLMKTIMQRFEARIFTKMANKEIPAPVGMFALKHHYGWGRDPIMLSYEDTSYLDDIEELAPEEEPETEEEMEEMREFEAQVKTEEVFLGIKVPPYQVFGKDFKLKLAAYNLANPQHPVSRPACYFMGIPPDGLPGIPFDGGYFLTLPAYSETTS